MIQGSWNSPGCLTLILFAIFFIFHPHYRLFLGSGSGPVDKTMLPYSSPWSLGALPQNLLGPLQSDSLYSILKRESLTLSNWKLLHSASFNQPGEVNAFCKAKCFFFVLPCFFHALHQEESSLVIPELVLDHQPTPPL